LWLTRGHRVESKAPNQNQGWGRGGQNIEAKTITPSAQAEEKRSVNGKHEITLGGGSHRWSQGVGSEGWRKRGEQEKKT